MAGRTGPHHSSSWRPGGSTDIVGRLIAAELSSRLKQQVIIDNRAGAGGIVGMQIATASPPDGYTLMLHFHGVWLSHRQTGSARRYRQVLRAGSLIGSRRERVGRASVITGQSVKDLIALAKADPVALNYASSGIGGFPHMNTEFFKLKTGVNLVHLPFKGGGPAIADVMAGHTQMYFGTLVTVMPFIGSGAP